MSAKVELDKDWGSATSQVICHWQEPVTLIQKTNTKYPTWAIKTQRMLYKCQTLGHFYHQ